ncbi:uncharacterized protein LOC143234435 isoform X2 [Tachypleus tridentatus]|uniref:uncharacterized protein LOC143234435 isoform X2 n=1 Tax=Tachypleus tridentatus TaxID=6853 RepID=UPI003FD429FE
MAGEIAWSRLFTEMSLKAVLRRDEVTGCSACPSNVTGRTTRGGATVASGTVIYECRELLQLFSAVRSRRDRGVAFPRVGVGRTGTDLLRGPFVLVTAVFLIL